MGERPVNRSPGPHACGSGKGGRTGGPEPSGRRPAALESIGATLVPLAQGPKDHLLTRASLRPTGALVGHFIGLKNKPTLRVYGQQDLNLHQMRREPKSRASTFFAMPVTAQPPRFVGWGPKVVRGHPREPPSAGCSLRFRPQHRIPTVLNFVVKARMNIRANQIDKTLCG